MPDPMSDFPHPPTAGSAEPGKASPANSAEPPVASEPASEFHIGEEFGTAKRNLPPAGIVLLSILIVAVVAGIIAFHERAKPQGAGAINFVSAVEIPNRNPGPQSATAATTMAAITFTLRNTADKSLWIRSLKAQLTTAEGSSYEDEAASAVDLDRYFQIFPPLKESAEPPISPETKLLPGTETRGTIVVSFPVRKEAFEQRKSLTVVIQPYDQPLPIVLK